MTAAKRAPAGRTHLAAPGVSPRAPVQRTRCGLDVPRAQVAGAADACRADCARCGAGARWVVDAPCPPVVLDVPGSK